MKPSKIFLLFLTVSLAIGTAVGCGDDDDDGSSGSSGSAAGAGGGGAEPDAGADASTGEQPDAAVPELEIAGTYTDNFDTSHEITGDTLTQVYESSTSVFEISDFSNGEQYIIAQNAEDNEYNAGEWSRFDWTEKDGKLWICQTVYNAESEQDALDAEPADDSDPASKGCGAADFAWSRLMLPGEISIEGTYTDDFGTSHEITGETWTQVYESSTSVFEISDFSNGEQYIIAQNAEDNEYNAGEWSRFDWTEKDGDLWICQGVYNAESEQAALDAEPADDSDPASKGCGATDFAWSKLTAE